MRQLLQIATVLSQNATVIAKYDVHYKLRQYNVSGGLFIFNKCVYQKYSFLRVLYMYSFIYKSTFEEKYFRGKKLQTCKENYNKRN